ncbi:MAG: putative lipoprotein [Edaphobacter sp.]|nr:putative lipoprotein [Edaphobacter sp.]
MNGFEKLMRTQACVAVCFGLTVGLGGCRHKAQVATLPAVLTPVALEEIPEPENLPMLEVPPASLPAVPAVASAGKPKREKKKPTPRPAPVQEPVQIAIVAPPPSPEDTAIGALTAGGEANPQTKQEAADLITSSAKRLNALPTQKAEDEKAQVSKVKNFLKDAQEALKTGDAEGAKTLATKAKLLLDDLEK